MTYCCNINASFPPNALDRLQYIQTRSNKIITNQCTTTLDDINQIIKRSVVIEVLKCVNDLGPNIFDKYFERFDHTKNTRGNKSLLRIPRVKTEMGRKSFKVLGATLFNKLLEMKHP